MKHQYGLVSIFVGIILCVGLSLSATAADVPDSVTIDKIKSTQPAVTFPHKAHTEKLAGKCGNCHVAEAGGGAIKPEFLVKPANMMEGMKGPWHGQCLECHKAAKVKAAPTACNGCHK